MDPLPQVKVIGNLWVYKTKEKQDGCQNKCKVYLVAQGYLQTPILDFNKTFSYVIKMTSVRVILYITLYFGWKICQLDVSNAFLNEGLEEDVYMR